MRRVIIIDPCLRDFVGHHYEYDRSIVDECRALGLDVVVLAHKDAAENLSDSWVIPAFSTDMWGGNKRLPAAEVRRGLILLGSVCLPARVITKLSRKVFENVRRATRVLKRRANASASSPMNAERTRLSRLLMPPPIQAAVRFFKWRGPKRIIASLVPPILHIPAQAVAAAMERLLDAVGIPRLFLVAAFKDPVFFLELTASLKRLKLQEQDVLFYHMLTGRQLAEVAAVSGMVMQCAAKSTLLLRYPLSFYEPTALSTRMALRVLERGYEENRVRLATDSHRLAYDFRHLTYVPFEVFPIPHSGTPGRFEPVRAAGKIVRVGSLGNARAEKGFIEIVAAIKDLNARGVLQNVEFVLQVNDPDTEALPHVHQLREQLPPNVTLVDQALNAEEYQALLGSLDVVLVPYWHEIYRARTSGIFLEAATAGKVVVATHDTWMSDLIEQYCAGALVSSRAPDELAKVLEDTLEKLSQHRAAAENMASRLREFHCAKSLVAQLTGHGLARDRFGRNALIVYPWHDLGTGAGGAATRTGLLVQLLRERGWNTKALSLEPGGLVTTEAPMKDVLVESSSIWKNSLMFFYVLCLRALSGGRASPAEVWFYMHRHWYRRRRFKRLLSQAIMRADVVFVEYTFVSELAARYAHSCGVPIVVSAHDVLAAAVMDPWFREKLLDREANGLRVADLAVTVSLSDQRMFQKAGVDSIVVPNAIRIPTLPERRQQRLDHLEKVASDGKPFVLFVGSRHAPNIEAKNFLKHFARECREEGDWLRVVIAGACSSEEESSQNFLCLGIVDSDTLAGLYARCIAVVVPLFSGTGTSLKTIEGMAYGRPVVGTPTAFRGYGVQDGQDAIMLHDLSALRSIIRGLLADPALAERLGSNGREFAKRYDYRLVYQPYIDFLVECERRCSRAPAPFAGRRNIHGQDRAVPRTLLSELDAEIAAANVAAGQNGGRSVVG